LLIILFISVGKISASPPVTTKSATNSHLRHHTNVFQPAEDKPVIDIELVLKSSFQIAPKQQRPLKNEHTLHRKTSSYDFFIKYLNG
jgi:hypothetical protein